MSIIEKNTLKTFSFLKKYQNINRCLMLEIDRKKSKSMYYPNVQGYSFVKLVKSNAWFWRELLDIILWDM